MEKEKIKSIQKEIEEAINEIGKKRGFRIKDGTYVTYSDTGFTFKANVLFTEDESGNAIDPEKELFSNYCRRHGLEPEDYNKEVRFHGDPSIYQIVGINPKARKNAIIIRNKHTGKTYVSPAEMLDDLHGKILVRNHHRCGYCGAAVPGTNEDVLCSDCRMLFGHALYSEL